MIKSIKFTGGFAKELLGDRSFEFEPGLNVIVGENGTGKSTILKTAKVYCSCPKDGGWTMAPERTSEKSIIEHFNENSPSPANVDWDGVSTYYHAVQSEHTAAHWDLYDHDLMSSTDSMQIMLGNDSAGQRRLFHLIQLNTAIRNPPVWNTIPEKFRDWCGEWTNYYSGAEHVNNMVEYVKGFYNDGPVTILLDEPERSLSLPYQFKIWNGLISKWVKEGFQVIVTSHSPFALMMKNANIIEMQPGFANESANYLLDCASWILANKSSNQ